MKGQVETGQESFESRLNEDVLWFDNVFGGHHR